MSKELIDRDGKDMYHRWARLPKVWELQPEFDGPYAGPVRWSGPPRVVLRFGRNRVRGPEQLVGPESRPEGQLGDDFLKDGTPRTYPDWWSSVEYYAWHRLQSVLSICRSLSKVGVPFRSMVATGGFRQRTQLENLKQEIDVLIATPGRFMFLVNEGFLKLTNLKSAILDEVDILYKDDDFELALQTLVSSAPVTAQYLFVTATLPVEIYNKLVEVFPDCEVIMGPGMHRTSPRLEEILINCSGDEKTERTPDTAFLNKKNALLQLVEGSPVPKTIVFCNKIETCRKVENALKRLDRKEACTKVLPFHAALEQDTRIANLEEFRRFPTKNISMFLVCTDRASRGMDFAGVDHVALFDFPRDPSEYVRRVGRTARGAGGKGKAFVFAVGKQVPLARKIIERNQKGHPLHDVPSAYEVMR
ncbi:DEAD-box ATP-dependent RNA helicase 50 [Orobanche gracilis]